MPPRPPPLSSCATPSRRKGTTIEDNRRKEISEDGFVGGRKTILWLWQSSKAEHVSSKEAVDGFALGSCVCLRTRAACTRNPWSWSVSASRVWHMAWPALAEPRKQTSESQRQPETSKPHESSTYQLNAIPLIQVIVDILATVGLTYQLNAVTLTQVIVRSYHYQNTTDKMDNKAMFYRARYRTVSPFSDGGVSRLRVRRLSSLRKQSNTANVWTSCGIFA